MGISNKIKEEEEEEEERKAYYEEKQEGKVCTIQELLFSSFSVDLLVGEEALIESTQALILPPPQPVSSTLRDGFVQMMVEAAPGASGLGTTACWKMAESHKETTTSMLKPDLVSEITFWLVIFANIYKTKTCMFL